MAIWKKHFNEVKTRTVIKANIVIFNVNGDDHDHDDGDNDSVDDYGRDRGDDVEYEKYYLLNVDLLGFPFLQAQCDSKKCGEHKYCDSISGECKKHLAPGSACSQDGQCKNYNGRPYRCTWGRCIVNTKPGSAGKVT